MNLQLQLCDLDNLNELVRISQSTFITAFEKDNNSDDFNTYIDFAFNKEKLKSELTNINSHFYFVFGDNELVGYFKLNENDAQTDVKQDDSIELERIYVLEAFQGKRIGQWMVTESKRIALDKQKGFLWLGVWEKNTSAIRFYQKHGFTKFGMHPYYIGKDKQMDWLMKYNLL